MKPTAQIMGRLIHDLMPWNAVNDLSLARKYGVAVVDVIRLRLRLRAQIRPRPKPYNVYPRTKVLWR